MTNLYTIVPLRAANARLLIEQSIGRGLRLPYGKRTGVTGVDQLNIIAHDRFQEIVEEANSGDSPIRVTKLVIGENLSLERQVVVVAKPKAIAGLISQPVVGAAPELPSDAGPMFTSESDIAVATATLAAIRRFRSLPSSDALKAPEAKALILEQVKQATAPRQGSISEGSRESDVEKVLEATLLFFSDNTIDIPRISLVPKGDVSIGFSDFDLDLTNVRVTPVSRDLVLQILRTGERQFLSLNTGIETATRPEDDLVSALIDYDDVSYDDHSELLYKLASQMVAHLKSYLPTEDDVRNAVRFHQKTLAENIYAQMSEHQWDRNLGYEAKVSEGFMELKELPFTRFVDDAPVFFRNPVEEPRFIRGLVFTGFKKCLYPFQKFDVNTERRFAVILEDDEDVLKWFKPAREQFQIFWSRDRRYEPDFVVETKTHRLLCETKKSDDIDSPEVVNKANAAIEWCEHASQYAETHGGKPWMYLLVPHYAAQSQMTMRGLVAEYGRKCLI